MAVPSARALVPLVPLVPLLARRPWTRTHRLLGIVAVPIAVCVVLLAAGIALQADIRLAIGLAVVSSTRALLVTPAPVAGAWSHGGAVARALLAPLALVVLVLSALHAPVAVIDDALLLGVLACVSGGLAGATLVLRRPAPRALLVGDEAGLRDLMVRWSDSRHLSVAGAYAPASGARSVAPHDLGAPLVGAPQQLAGFVRRAGVDVVLVAAGTVAQPGEVRRLEWLLAGTGVPVLCAQAVDHVAPHRLRWTAVDGTTLSVIACPSRASRLVKSLGDRVVGLALLVAAAPVIAALAVIVRIDSRGPALFAQSRVGRDGRTFTLYKIRTMTTDAEDAKVLLLDLNEAGELLFKIRDDPRVTRVGRRLRVCSLDELPQLWNVVRGDMSLVGPRPALPDEVARYTELERRRLAVKPGLTGPWQVSGRSSLSRERSMQLDAGYADNWHPASDARILLRTFDAVLSRRGAY